KPAQRDRGAKAPRAGSAQVAPATQVAPGGAGGADGAAGGDGAGGRTDGRTRQQKAEAYVPRLKEKYAKEVAPALMKEFGYSNPMQTPQVKKVVLNIGMGGEARENAKALDNAVGDVATITGQKAVITRAKKSIASFKLRTGMPIG